MYYVYVLKSLSFDRIYIGLTDNVEKRLEEHNSGKTKSTKGYKPYELAFVEQFKTRIEAREREKFLKSGSARKRIKEKIRARSSTG